MAVLEDAKLVEARYTTRKERKNKYRPSEKEVVKNTLIIMLSIKLPTAFPGTLKKRSVVFHRKLQYISCSLFCQRADSQH